MRVKFLILALVIAGPSMAMGTIGPGSPHKVAVQPDMGTKGGGGPHKVAQPDMGTQGPGSPHLARGLNIHIGK